MVEYKKSYRHKYGKFVFIFQPYQDKDKSYQVFVYEDFTLSTGKFACKFLSNDDYEWLDENVFFGIGRYSKVRGIKVGSIDEIISRLDSSQSQ